MIKLNLTNLEKLNLVPDWQKSADFLPIALEQFKARNQGFYQIVDDLELVEQIESYAEKACPRPRSGVRAEFTDVVILGIGGSALGATTLRDSLTSQYDPNQVKLHVLDNVDPDRLSAVRQSLDLNKTLFIAITKSGGTAETLSQYGYFRQELEQANLDLTKHLVCITGPDGFFRDAVNRDGLTSFPIPLNVGGRFSVLTAVGLLPAALIGIDIRALMKGAQEMRDRFLSEKSAENFPFQLATIQYELFQQGYTNCVLMPYVQRLKTFADWYKQLLAESTGKIDAHGNHTGITPMAALGATDQHSQVQQFMQGLDDKQFIIMKQHQFAAKLPIPDLGDHPKVQMLKDVDFGQLLNAECDGTTDTLTENKRPNLILEFKHLNAKVLGQLIFLFEGATAFLGEYLQIDAFDQPGVERSKVLTREYLMKDS